MRIKSLKTGTKAWRTIDLDDGTVDALTSCLNRIDSEREAIGAGYDQLGLGLVFCRADGAPYDIDVVNQDV